MFTTSMILVMKRHQRTSKEQSSFQHQLMKSINMSKTPMVMMTTQLTSKFYKTTICQGTIMSIMPLLKVAMLQICTCNTQSVLVTGFKDQQTQDLLLYLKKGIHLDTTIMTTVHYSLNFLLTKVPIIFSIQMEP